MVATNQPVFFKRASSSFLASASLSSETGPMPWTSKGPYEYVWAMVGSFFSVYCSCWASLFFFYIYKKGHILASPPLNICSIFDSARAIPEVS